MPDGSTIGYILCFVFLIFASAFFSASEMALCSVNKIHIITSAEGGNKKAKRALNLIEGFDETLTVLLIANNIVNISCATLATVLAYDIAEMSAKIDQATAVTIATFATTVIIILFGEILPKSFGKACSEKYLTAVGGILVVTSAILKPLTLLFKAISGTMAKLFLKNTEEEPTVTEDEFQDIVDSLPEANNDFDEDVAKLVSSAMKFSNATVTDILIPWDKVVKLSSGLKTEQIAEFLNTCKHSRIPVVGRNGDVKGVLRIRNFFKAYISKRKNVVLASVMDRPFYCDEDKALDDMLKILSAQRRNLAIIRNRDGEILGIVTVEDILETLVGQIYDETDQEVAE